MPRSTTSFVPVLRTSFLVLLPLLGVVSAAPSAGGASLTQQRTAAAREAAEALDEDIAEGSCSLLQTIADLRPGSGNPSTQQQRSLLSQGGSSGGRAASAAGEEESAGISSNGSIVKRRRTASGLNLGSVVVMSLMLGLLVCMVSLLLRLYGADQGKRGQMVPTTYEDPFECSPERLPEQPAAPPPHSWSATPSPAPRRGTYHLARPSSKVSNKPSPTVGDLPPNPNPSHSSSQVVAKPICVQFDLADSDDEVVEFSNHK